MHKTLNGVDCMHYTLMVEARHYFETLRHLLCALSESIFENVLFSKVVMQFHNCIYVTVMKIKYSEVVREMIYNIMQVYFPSDMCNKNEMITQSERDEGRSHNPIKYVFLNVRSCQKQRLDHKKLFSERTKEVLVMQWHLYLMTISHFFNLTHFQSHTLPISHSSNFTLFQSHTLPISHSSNLMLFQSHTLPSSHSSNFTLFQSHTSNLTLF